VVYQLTLAGNLAANKLYGLTPGGNKISFALFMDYCYTKFNNNFLTKL